MQKKLIALALAAGFSGAAFAQSNVQVYGILDVGVQNANFGNGSTTRVQGSGQFTERLGFQGTEDLGSGLKANFRLEMGINTDTGNLDNSNATANQLFQREAWVGLEGSFGQVNLGRQYTPIFKFAQAQADVFNVAGIGSNYALTSTGMTRASNSIRWNSPNMNGLTATVMTGLGDAGNANYNNESLVSPKNQGTHTGLGLNYVNGPLTLLYAYGKQNNAPGAGGNIVATKANIAGGAYNFGPVTLVAGYETAKNDPGTLDVKGFVLSAVVPVGADSLKASYTSLKDNNGTTASASAGKSSLVALGYVHPLSKRTSLYGTWARMTNDSLAKRSLLAQTGGGTQAVAADFDPSGFAIGVSHTF